MAFRYSIGYTLLFGLLFMISQYDVWLQLPPASMHQWRQADGASIAWHYAQNLCIGEVQVNNLFYTGDNHAAGELPLLYWLSGLMTRSGLAPDYPLRWIGLFLLFGGGWAFGWMVLTLTGLPLVAALSAGLLLTSPVLSYYGPGFLPDAPAFCFVLIMAACVLQAERRQSGRWLGAGAFFAALAIALKLSMALLPLALAGAWALGRYRGQWPAGSIWNGNSPLWALAGGTGVILVFFWRLALYNSQHQAIYFLRSTRPVWNYDGAFIRETLYAIGVAGVPAFASVGLYLAGLASLWLWIKHWKSTPVMARNTLVFAALGGLAYSLLWFRMLREHDYYLICLLAIPVILLLNGYRLAASRHPLQGLPYALGVCLLIGGWHNRYILSERLRLAFHPQNSLSLPPDAFLAPGRLEAAGVPEAARVLCPQDPSPNIALLALQRHGWTAYNFGDRINADTLHKYQTRFGLTHLALRDTAWYSPLYRQFFPVRDGETQGWFVFSR